MPRRSVSLARHARCVTKSFADAVLKVHGTVDNVPVLGDVNTEEVVRVRDAFMATGAAT